MFVPELLSLAQSDAVYDGRVVEFIWDDGILGSEQNLENASVGIEARGVQDSILATVELRDFRFKLLQNNLKALN